jgi:hypothetical protein
MMKAKGSELNLLATEEKSLSKNCAVNDFTILEEQEISDFNAIQEHTFVSLAEESAFEGKIDLELLDIDSQGQFTKVIPNLAKCSDKNYNLRISKT